MRAETAVGLGSFALGWALSSAAAGQVWPLVGQRERLPLPLSAAGVLEVAAALGFRRVQLADNAPVDTLSEPEWHALRARAQRLELALELGMRGLKVDAVRRHLARAAEVASPFLRIVIDLPGYEPSPDEIVRLLRSLLPDLERNGVVLAIENHDRFAARDLAAMIAAVESPWLGICLDTANSLGAGEGLDTVAEALAPHVVNVHLKDFVVHRQPHQFGFVVEGAPLGQGWCTRERMQTMLARLPRCQSLTLEHWVSPLPGGAPNVAEEARWCELSTAALRAWFPAAGWRNGHTAD